MLLFVWSDKNDRKTMEEMIDFCAQFVDEVNKNMPKPMTQEEYKQMMRQYFPMLKRWKSAQ
jgi:hypothetical protein